jgi:hypothetical protein
MADCIRLHSTKERPIKDHQGPSKSVVASNDFLLDLRDFAAFVIAAGRTGLVTEDRIAAVAADGGGGRIQRTQPVGFTLRRPGVRGFSFRRCHFFPPLHLKIWINMRFFYIPIHDTTINYPL